MDEDCLYLPTRAFSAWTFTPLSIATTLLAIQTGLVLALLWQRRKRRLAEAELAIPYGSAPYGSRSGKVAGVGLGYSGR
jgi:hypothetical protein